MRILINYWTAESSYKDLARFVSDYITRIEDSFGITYEFLIIAENNIKKAIILRFGTVDLHWLVLKQRRKQHVLNDALRTGILAKVWPENKKAELIALP